MIFRPSRFPSSLFSNNISIPKHIPNMGMFFSIQFKNFFLHLFIDINAGSIFPTPGKTSPSKSSITSLKSFITETFAPFLFSDDSRLKIFPAP
jgi:hypothetical protein